ncbi:type III-D CRISPR-associated RAMP protein Csx10 [Thermoflexus hugenholtzii]
MGVWLRLKPRSPLLIGRLKADSAYLVTLPYIPGRVVRGAWAEDRRMAGNAATISAAARQLQIWNFHPIREGMAYSLPLPLSAWTCKRHPGFRPQGHGVLDSLIPRWVYRLLEEGARPPVPFQIVCDVCEDRMTPVGGYYGVSAGGGRARISVPLQFQTKVALSRPRRAAMEGMLYQVTAIAPQEDLAFVGRVHGPPNLIREVEAALTQVGVGALTRRGYGQVQVGRGDPPAYPGLRERVEQFNEIFRKVYEDLARLVPGAPLPEGTFFTIDLLAPGVFREDPLGPPVLWPTLELGGRTLRPVFCITRPTLVGGWSTAWGLPKPVDLAASPGSAYGFRWDPGWGPLDFKALERLEETGVGERTDEGFGELMVCHPFHLEVEPV